jgi:hypothetical protein
LTFSRHDKHVQAFSVLLGPQSVKMAAILGIVDKETKESLVHRDVRCLTCHVGMPLTDLKTDGRLVDAEFTKDFRMNLGVSCEACHGAGGDGPGDQKGWNSVHQQGKPTWRFMSPQEKRQRYGYYDVHDSIARTKLCVSCHVGSVPMGRVVTHEMYAAGHPPLSSFEVESCFAQFPPHWQELDSKPKDVRDEFLAKLPRRPGDANTLLHARNVVVGALITFSQSLRLSADLADRGVAFPDLPGRGNEPAKEPAKDHSQSGRFAKPEWPEFSQFACYACHHELRTPSWRQQRGFVTTPGRPVFHEWPTALLKPALASVGKEKELAEPMDKLTKLLNARPFGEPQALVRDARQVADWAEAAAEALDRGTFTKAMASQLLSECVRLASTTAPDYDAARSIVLACNVIYQETERNGPAVYTGKDGPGWFRNASDLTAVEKAFAALQTDFQLDLHLGQSGTVHIPGESKPRPVIEVEMPEIFRRPSNYDPQKLNIRFREIEALLNGKGPPPPKGG